MTKPKPALLEISKIRVAIANYIKSEGCSCCQGCDHKEHKEILAKMLNVPKYRDDSGYDFGKFEVKP